MMENGMISVVLPFWGSVQDLEETVDTLQKQTYENFEALCLLPSGESELAVYLNQMSGQDGRFHLITLDGRDLGTARNRGLKESRGLYVMFIDVGTTLAPNMLEKLYTAAESNDASFAICDFVRRQAGGRAVPQTGINKGWLSVDASKFSYQDTPDYILRIADPFPGNKLYRTEFLRQKELVFEEYSSVPEFSFVSVCSAAADRITYVPECLLQSPVGAYPRPKALLKDIENGMFKAVEKIRSLPYADALNNAVLSFFADSLILSMPRYIRDFSGEDAAAFYKTAHEIFNRKEFENVTEKTFHNLNRYLEFSTVKKHDYETMKKLVSRRIIVSMTSYPKRIGAVAKALESIYAQTRKADEIILWLAEDQFPDKLADLPEELRRLVSENRLTVRWCEDLKGHKKYFYALQEYTEDVVVTIDDDLLYPKDMLAVLYKSYLLHPNAVSTMRAHLITVSDQNQIMPYREWVQETDACLHEPSMQLMASGGAGDLYPPDLYCKEFFDVEAAKELCLWADNIWVKVMELVSDVPVVLAKPSAPLCCVDGTQEETLFQINGDLNQYDVQLQKISEWLDSLFWKDILNEKLTASQIGKRILGTEAVTAHVNKERKVVKAKLQRTERELQQLKEEQKRLRDSLNQAESKEKQASEQLAQTQQNLRKTEGELGQIRNRLRHAEETKSVKRQLKDLGKSLQSQKAEDGISFGWCFKYLVYLLAWIPEILLGGMMFFLENGVRQTAKYAYRKLFKRK